MADRGLHGASTTFSSGLHSGTSAMAVDYDMPLIVGGRESPKAVDSMTVDDDDWEFEPQNESHGKFWGNEATSLGASGSGNGGHLEGNNDGFSHQCHSLPEGMESACEVPSPPVEGNTTFKLMEICNDSQDLSFVEKVLLSQDEIVNLCNNIAAESAKECEGRKVIDFDLLNRESKRVVGFFGSKDVMLEIFRNANIAQDRETLGRMQNDSLPAGLYVCQGSESLFIFYWHHGLSLPEATRKDMSCNFIRYIFDLCDTVCVCLEGKNLLSSLFTSAPKLSKRQRNQRLQISLVKASDDSATVKEGFLVNNLRMGSKIAGPKYKLSEGHSRLALLQSCVRPRILLSVKNKRDVNVKNFPHLIEEWRQDFCLDVSALSDADLILFLRCAKLKQGDEYTELLASHDKRKLEQKNMVYNVDSLVMTEENRLARSLVSFVNAYLQYRYPWEESLLACLDHRPAPHVTEFDHKSQVESQLHSPGLTRPSTPNSNDSEEISLNRLTQLESEIYSVLLGKDSVQRLVFFDSEVLVSLPEPEFSKSRASSERTIDCGVVYKIEWPGTQTKIVSSKFTPILYGNEVVLRRKDVNSQSKAINIKVTLHRHGVKDYDGSPLLTHEEIACIPVGFRKKPEKIKFEPPPSSGKLNGIFLDWAHHVAQMTTRHLWKTAALLSQTLIYEKLVGTSSHGCDEVVLRRILASDNPLEELDPLLTKDLRGFARNKWTGLADGDFQNGEACEQIIIRDPLNMLCEDVYLASRVAFQTRIVGMIKRCSNGLISKRIREEITQDCERLEDSLKVEARDFLATLRSDLFGGKADLLTLKLESCRLKKKSVAWTSRLFNASSSMDESLKVSLNFTHQEFENETLTWRGSELAPMKADSERLTTDAEHRFTPSCSDFRDIINLDPRTQTLSRIVFLKGGQLLLFVIEDHVCNSGRDLVIYVCPSLGSKVTRVREMKRGFDLFAYDEQLRYVAFYDAAVSIIKIFRFDETFRHMDWTGVDVVLGEYAGIGPLSWMDFVSGKNEIVFIDHGHRVRLCEITQPAMVRTGNIHLGQNPIIKACVSTRGSCLLVIREANKMEHLNREDAMDVLAPESGDLMETDGLSSDSGTLGQRLVLEVFRLNDTIVRSNSIPLELVVRDLSKLQFGIVSFASQMHLVIHDSEVPHVLASKVIKISSASEVCQLEHVIRPEEIHTNELQTKAQPGPVLDYVYQVFEKFATSPPLIPQSRHLHVRLLLKENSESLSTSVSATRVKVHSLSEKCLQYVYSSICRLEREKGKNFSSLRIHSSIHDVKNCTSFLGNSSGSSLSFDGSPDVPMGDWMRRLACLVPIQIARAENNTVKPMVNGMQLSTNVDFVDAISLANVIRFGLYEAVLESWTGSIKVISSMGKQSSGKSYLLNHLSGSLLDVAGGRCTDGVWMTVRQGGDALYVLLDFEGLGSFERSEQEDMLLSILSAAVSNLTIFNKKDFQLDKETEAIFERFQNGVTLVKTDPKLFRGLFYMAIKDVDSSDVEDLKREFFSKISYICSKSQDNFLTKMYGGAVEISAMPSFNRPEFHDSIAEIGCTIEDLDGSYVSGRSFLTDLKLIISQISTKDWSTIDSKRISLRINLLKTHLSSAISIGCVFSDGALKHLTNFDDQVVIPDKPLDLDASTFSIPDTSLELFRYKESKVTSDVLLMLLKSFKSRFHRNGRNDEEWHASFERFISILVHRRKDRVLRWIQTNTSEFGDDGDIQKLQLEAEAMLAEVQLQLLLCSCKCEMCFLRCVQEKGHPSSHSCNGSHVCEHVCTYCLEEDTCLGPEPCNDVAGHEGPHDCREKSHTCGKCCSYAATSSNCNTNCAKKSGHTGDHLCNSKQHMCSEYCSLPSCKNRCVSPIDLGEHDNHFCHEKFCPVKCSMRDCNRTCKEHDHFHGLKPGVTHHFCGSEHLCTEKCEHEGSCEVMTEVCKKTQTFKGKRATFDYELVSEQNGIRKGCCIVIPAGKVTHEGSHSHSTKVDVVHFCETRCKSCWYFCHRPAGHGGLHDTTHGNMRAVNFVAESEDIDILDRKYTWGESGVAELCQMHCKAQGRGHLHLILCPAYSDGRACRKIFDGSQHETRKYGPNVDTPKDEMTHEVFWEYMRFEDPCSADERKQYALCSHQCKSGEHSSAASDASTTTQNNISYCTEKLWHDPVCKRDFANFGSGYITDDGHHFSCDHSRNVAMNVIFVIDRSGSMEHDDSKPSMAKFHQYHNGRLGCVYEAILRFIRTRVTSVKEDVVSVILFDDDALTVVSLADMTESVVDRLLSYYPQGSTNYSSGLQHVKQILERSLLDPSLSCKSPVVIFLSDGDDFGRRDPLLLIAEMKALDAKLELHTIMFGKDSSTEQSLIDMAKAGDGTFERSLDEVQLTRRFEELAKSLRPKVVSLM